MSDASQGPGWWIASDGKWYAPELHPGYHPPPPADPPPDVARCHACGSPVSPRDRQCPSCRAALTEEQSSTTRIGRFMTVTTSKNVRVSTMSPAGHVETLVRTCDSCGATTQDPQALTCANCNSPLPSLQEEFAHRIASVAPGQEASAQAISADAIASAVEQAGISSRDIPSIVGAIAGAVNGQGCPRCNGRLEVQGGGASKTVTVTFTRSRDSEVRASGGLLRRSKSGRQPLLSVNSSGAAGAPSVGLVCPGCGYSVPAS